jgi:hypothetical protein
MFARLVVLFHHKKEKRLEVRQKSEDKVLMGWYVSVL